MGSYSILFILTNQNISDFPFWAKMNRMQDNFYLVFLQWMK